MRVDPDSCRDPDLLVAEVRRLHAVIEAGEPSFSGGGKCGETVNAQVAWHGVPVAWAAVSQNGQPLWLAYHRCDADGAVVGMAKVVPLYRSPTLTDAEREALLLVMVSDASDCVKAAIGGLLDRTE